MNPPPVYTCRAAFFAIVLVACGGTTFEAGNQTSFDASFDSNASAPEDSGVRQGYTDGGADAFFEEAAVDSGFDARSIDAASLDAGDAAIALDAAPDGPPNTCAAADNAIGCCYGNVNYYCNYVGQMVVTDCTQENGVCGFSVWSNGQGWICLVGVQDAAAYPGPSQYPRQCQ
jgi:hypothetical protein